MLRHEQTEHDCSTAILNAPLTWFELAGVPSANPTHPSNTALHFLLVLKQPLLGLFLHFGTVKFRMS